MEVEPLISQTQPWWLTELQWLFLNTLDSVARVRAMVEFYVNEHNTKMPHPAFSGQTVRRKYSVRTWKRMGFSPCSRRKRPQDGCDRLCATETLCGPANGWDLVRARAARNHDES